MKSSKGKKQFKDDESDDFAPELEQNKQTRGGRDNGGKNDEKQSNTIIQ